MWERKDTNNKQHPFGATAWCDRTSEWALFKTKTTYFNKRLFMLVSSPSNTSNLFCRVRDSSVLPGFGSLPTFAEPSPVVHWGEACLCLRVHVEGVGGGNRSVILLIVQVCIEEKDTQVFLQMHKVLLQLQNAWPRAGVWHRWQAYRTFGLLSVHFNLPPYRNLDQCGLLSNVSFPWIVYTTLQLSGCIWWTEIRAHFIKAEKTKWAGTRLVSSKRQVHIWKARTDEELNTRFLAQVL